MKLIFKSQSRVVISVFALLLLFQLIAVKKQFTESRESLDKRIRFHRKLMKEVSSDTVELKYSDEGGMFCSAKNKYVKDQIMFKIPNEYIVSSCI
jgi:hypothetical protein